MNLHRTRAAMRPLVESAAFVRKVFAFSNDLTDLYLIIFIRESRVFRYINSALVRVNKRLSRNRVDESSKRISNNFEDVDLSRVRSATNRHSPSIYIQ